MKETLIFIALSIFILGCGDSEKLDSCLQALDIISINKFPNGDVEYEVIGKVADLSKGAYEFEQAIKQTLNLPEGVVAGCLIFEENFPECFGYFMIDRRQSADYSSIKLEENAKVTLLRVELDEIIPLTARKQKNVQYLYLIREIEQPILNGE